MCVSKVIGGWLMVEEPEPLSGSTNANPSGSGLKSDF